MAPMLDIAKKDYERASKILELAGVEYSVPKQEEVKVKDNSDWIYVPSINLEISKNKILHGENFYDTREKLHSNNQKMLTIPEFREFLKYTKENHKDTYDEITQIKSPWRAEWLGADFKIEGKDLVVNYYIFDKDGKLIKKTEKLDKNTLMKDKTPGISLEAWLQDSTKQGLPKNIIKSGDLYYWCPRRDNNFVAGFLADVGGAVLGCDWILSGARILGYEQRSCENNSIVQKKFS